MMRSNLVRLACCCFIAAVSFGQIKKVTLKDGRAFQGVVTETKDGYQIEWRPGATITVAKDQVMSVEEVVTPEQEYRRRLAQIDAKDPKARFKLGQWAIEKDLLDIARTELKAALALKKDYEVAALLLRQVEAKIKPPTRTRPSGVRPRLPGGVEAAGINPKWLVTDEDIYRIRLEELRQTDRVRVRFRNNLINRFIEMMQGRGDFVRPGFAGTFRGLSPVRQARYILNNIDRDSVEIKDDIRIKTDPGFMIEFRRRVWPIVASYCASADCHGGRKAGGKLRLLTIAAKNQKVDYTNFLHLESFVDKRGRMMIDRDRMEDSLLLQFGLPPEQARYSHPERTRPAYPDRTAANYRDVLRWIESLQGPPHPEYRVKLRLPWAPKRRRVRLPGAESPLTQPASQPAEKPPI